MVLILRLAILRLPILLVLISSVGGLTPARAQDGSPPCPDSEILQSEIASFKAANTALLDLSEGRSAPDARLESLFRIDITDESAVAQRRAELSHISKAQHAEPREDCSVIADLFSEHQTLRRTNADLKLRFFDLPLDLRKTLAAKQNLLVELSSAQDQLEAEIRTQEARQLAARKAEDAAADALVKSKDETPAEISEARLALSAANGAVAAYHVKWLSQVRELVSHQKSSTERMILLSTRFQATDDSTERLRDYEAILGIWRALVDDGLTLVRSTLRDEKFPELPVVPAETLTRFPDFAEVYQTEFRSVRDKVADVQSSVRRERLALTDKHYHVLDQASALRSQMYQAVKDLPNYDRRVTLESRLQDILRETRAVPVRALGLVFTKILTFRNTLNKGFGGYLDLGRDGSVLLVLLLLPFVGIVARKKIAQGSDQLRMRLVRKGGRATQFALILRRLTPYLPTLVAYGLFSLAQSLMASTSYHELGVFLKLAEYIILYRIFRRIVNDVYDALRLRIDLNASVPSSTLIDGTAKLVGRFYLTVAIIQYLTRLAVGEVLIYSLVLWITRVVGVLILCLAAERWSFVLRPLAQDTLGKSFGARVARLCEGPKAYLFCLPIFALILLILLAQKLWQFVETFDLGRRLSARLYRHRMEALKNSDNKGEPKRELSPEYRLLFGEEGLREMDPWCAGNDDELRKVKDEIDLWLSGRSSEQSLVLFGEKGSGKTSLLQRVRLDYAAIRSVSVAIPSRLRTREECRHFMAEVLGVGHDRPLSEALDERGARRGEPPTLILIDEAQNLFLGVVGGFEAYLEFVTLLNAAGRSYFWCLAMNEHAWDFLKGYLGRRQHLRVAVRIKPWSEEELGELIMSRHKRSDLGLQYDHSILATESELKSDSYEEKQFFRLLWEQTKGNPRVAIQTWLETVYPESDARLHVPIPRQFNAKLLEKLSDEACFVYAAIAKHENLILHELCDCLNLEPESVALELKFGEEASLLQKDQNGRYRLATLWLTAVITHLRRKNFLHGHV